MEAYLEVFTSFGGIVSLFTLIVLEVILGIDNIIFIAVICGYIPNKKEQNRARFIGLMLALIIRIVLLTTISFISKAIEPLFHIGSIPVSGRGIILFGGGVFLIVKTFIEIYHKFREANDVESVRPRVLTWTKAIFQIALIDVVFSFDSIITAVGVTADNPNAPVALATMIMAVVVAMVFMLLFAPIVSDFLEKYPTTKMLALAFLIAIGVILITEALQDAHIMHLPEGINIKTYAYVALLFSGGVEWLNIRLNTLNVRKQKAQEKNK